jgi:hypothetical protein
MLSIAIPTDKRPLLSTKRFRGGSFKSITVRHVTLAGVTYVAHSNSRAKTRKLCIVAENLNARQAVGRSNPRDVSGLSRGKSSIITQRCDCLPLLSPGASCPFYRVSHRIENDRISICAMLIRSMPEE